MNWDLAPNFKREEFDHGGPEMLESFMLRLQTARTICRQLCLDAGVPEVPFVINSGSRSIERNQQVGGKPDSTHLYGCACDIRARSSRDKFFIVKSLLLAGFVRILTYDNFVHVDEGHLLSSVNKISYVLR